MGEKCCPFHGIDALNCAFHPGISGCYWKVSHFTVGTHLIQVLLKLINWPGFSNSLGRKHLLISSHFPLYNFIFINALEGGENSILIHLVMSLQCAVTAKKSRTILRYNWGNIVSWDRIAIVPSYRPSERWLLEYIVQFLDISQPERFRSNGRDSAKMIK